MTFIEMKVSQGDEDKFVFLLSASESTRCSRIFDFLFRVSFKKKAKKGEIEKNKQALSSPIYKIYTKRNVI